MMKFMRWEKSPRGTLCAAGVVTVLSLAGCGRDEPKVYRIPKDDSAPAQPAPAPAPETTTPAVPSPDMSASMPGAAPEALPPIKYQLPEGWQEKPPSEMRVASFTALGPGGLSADVSVIPLPIVGRDLELINMWRSQVQLPPTTDPDAVKQAESTAIGADEGRLFGFVSDQPMIGKSRHRIFIATLTRGSMTWFFKMDGDDAFVLSQKPKFLQFLKSVTFDDSTPDQMSAAPAPPAQGVDAGSIWTVPSDWQSVPPSQFLLAEFSVPGAGGAKAEVNVAAMEGEGGGLLANVNRWRGQIGLGPILENDLDQSPDRLGGAATLVDYTGTDAKTGAPTRLVGAIVSENGQTWFYKLMGDPKVVAQQKEAFTKFIQSANYANAR
jgi:hypothetical protein